MQAIERMKAALELARASGSSAVPMNPEIVSEVLAHIEAQQAEIEQLRAQRGEPENIDPTGSNLPAEQANTPEVTSQGQVSVPVLWRYRDSEQCIKPMDGYTPGEGWTPLYAAPQPERKPTTRKAFEEWVKKNHPLRQFGW